MTSLNPNLLDLLERYVSDDMSESERLNFEDRLSKEQEIEEALDFFLAFETEKENFGRILFKEHLQKVDAEMVAEEVKETPIHLSDALKAKIQHLANLMNKGIDEIAAWFQPVPEYQLLLQSTHRSHTTGKVVTPESGQDYSNVPLNFELDGNTNYLLTIENNARQQIVEYIIQEQQQRFSIDVSGYNTGRYYWKLIDTKSETLVIGDFFIMLNVNQ